MLAPVPERLGFKRWCLLLLEAQTALLVRLQSLGPPQADGAGVREGTLLRSQARLVAF